MKKLSAICGLAALVVGAHSTAVNASTVFTPTDGNVNFYTLSFTPLPSGHSVAIFEDTDTSFFGSSATVLNSTYGASIATFTPAGPNTSVTVNPILSSVNLLGNSNYILGYNNGSGWAADTSIAYIGADGYKVTFANGGIIQIDVAVVPVPAAAWLFGTGLIGLVGVARRKQH